ncbi:MAG TPA: hypothetical protein PK597_06790 [Oscillospiraceae bacterium]|nr:hypothetical protein [Oscillospiraceae bacterium]HRW57964.1 hypothetical protein [Oscillospiraceae bacterium]
MALFALFVAKAQRKRRIPPPRDARRNESCRQMRFIWPAYFHGEKKRAAAADAGGGPRAAAGLGNGPFPQRGFLHSIEFNTIHEKLHKS